jgi:hypothetical protein
VTGEGGRHCFTNYINNRQELIERNEKGMISKSYLFDFKRISWRHFLHDLHALAVPSGRFSDVGISHATGHRLVEPLP